MSQNLFDEDAIDLRTMPLRELIAKTQDDLNTYKNPDVSVITERLHDILKAGKLGGIIHDKLISLYFANGSLHIRTEYSVRSCMNSAYFEFPEFVVDAADPEYSVAVWAWTQAINKTYRDIESTENKLEGLRADLAKLQKEFDEMQARSI